MAKLIYLYTTEGAPRTDALLPWDITQQTKSPFAQRAISDGMVELFNQLALQGIVDSTIITIDSTRYPGYLQVSPKTSIYVIPTMNCIKEFLNPGDIVIVRGAFKSWIPLLQYIQNTKRNWILYYRANTCHHAWPFWDIILNDLIAVSKISGRRLHFNFSKPVNENIFGPIDSPKQLPKVYDIMIGASHIHRKKGQYLTVQALLEYEKFSGKRLKAIMPGGYITCTTNRLIWDTLKSGRVDIETPKSLTRQQLCLRMNQTKLFVHSGVGGQNDRGVLEAMCCRVPVLVTSKAHFSPFVWEYGLHATRSPLDIALNIQTFMLTKVHTVADYPAINGLHEIAIPKMRSIIEFIFNNPTPNRVLACDYFSA